MIERIKSLIHRVIRTSPLEHLILETLHYKESKVPEYKDIVKCYLKKEYHFGPQTKKKYMLFIEQLQQNLPLVSEGFNDKILLQFYQLYEIPKKQNNILLVLLTYYYLNKKVYPVENVIYDVIYIYYMIIIFRLRYSNQVKNYLIDMDEIEFKSFKIGALINKFTQPVYRTFQHYKYPFLATLGVCILSVLFLPLSYFSGDILTSHGIESEDINRILASTLVLGDPDSGSIGKVVENGLPWQNIFLFAVIILGVRIVRDRLSETILAEGFDFVRGMVKRIFTSIFFIYYWISNYFTTNLVRLYIYPLMKWRYNISGFLLSILFIVYLTIQYVLILLHIILIQIIFDLELSSLVLHSLTAVIMIVFFVFNLYKDYMNLKTFLIKVDGFLGFLKGETVKSEE